MRVPQNRRGFSGWKLTKRPLEIIDKGDALGVNGNGYLDQSSMLGGGPKKGKGRSKKRGMSNGHGRV
jgi:hypothetical protein